MEHGHDLHSGLLRLREIGIAGTGVTDDTDILVKVDGVHFGQLTSSGNGLENAHSHSDLDIALYGAGGTLLDQHGEGWNQHGVQLTGNALGEAVIVRSHKGDLLVLDPLLKSNYILCHIPDGFHGSAALDVEGVQNVLGFGTDGGFIGNIVGNRPHLLPVELLGVQPHTVVQVGLVNVQIHHAGIGAANLGKVRIPEAAAHLRGTAPVLNFCLCYRVSALNNTGDDGVALPGPLQIGHHLTHCAAGVQLPQPGGGVGVCVVGSLLLLKVHQHHGNVQVPDSREHIVGGGIGQQLHNDQIYVRSPELVPGSGT